MKYSKLIIFCIVAAVSGYFLTVLSAKPVKNNVIYVMIDTLRADHLGVYGYERNTSPTLDAFAKENLLFKHAFTTVPWTPPSISSQLSGLYAASHNMVPPPSRELAKTKSIMFNSKIITLPEVLKNNGYFTAGVSSNPWITELYGFDKEFDELVYRHREDADVINKAGFDFLDRFIAEKKNFFLYLHYLDPHNPYKPPKEYKKMFSGNLQSQAYPKKTQVMINNYDGEIRFLDDQLALLFEKLKKNNLYDDSIIIIVADHGEQFDEHGNQGHGYQLFNEEVHVPLMIKLPGKNKPQVIENVVSQIDIFPTVLEILGIDPVPGLQGVSLINQDALQKRKGIMTEITRHYIQKAYIDRNKRKLILGDTKVTADAAKAPPEEAFKNMIGIFDYTTKPLEVRVEPEDSIRQKMQDELREIFIAAKKAEHLPEGVKSELPEEVLDELQTLGYF